MPRVVLRLVDTQGGLKILPKLEALKKGRIWERVPDSYEFEVLSGEDIVFGYFPNLKKWDRPLLSKSKVKHLIRESKKRHKFEVHFIMPDNADKILSKETENAEKKGD